MAEVAVATAEPRRRGAGLSKLTASISMTHNITKVGIGGASRKDPGSDGSDPTGAGGGTGGGRKGVSK